MERDDAAHQAREAKRRRVTNACTPCKQAHGACDRERPCKRCVALGKPEECIEMDSSRRRGRPKRASEEQKQQLKQLQRELAAHREYMSAQDQAREAATATLGGRSGPSAAASGQPPAASRREDRVAQQENEAMNGLAGQLLDEFKNLSGEVREMRREIAQVRHMQNLHETQFSLILPLIASLDKGPPSPLSTSSSTSASCVSSSSSSPQTSSCPSAPVLDSLYPQSLEPYGQTFTPSQQQSPAMGPDATQQGLTPNSFFSQLATSSAYPSPLPLSTLLSSNVSMYAQQQPSMPSATPLPSSRHSTSPPPPPAPGVLTPHQFGVHDAPTHAQDNITLYQQDTVIPSNPSRYTLDGFGGSPSTRKAMLALLPFLSKYNIISTDVPFVVSDSTKPIISCSIHERRPGDELRPRINFANTAFCDLSLYSIDELLGYSIRKFILLEDAETWRDFRKSVLPCLTMRSLIPLSPILSLRALARKRDSSLLLINSRVQVFYDEMGYSGWYVLVVDDYEQLGRSAPPYQLPVEELVREPLPRVRQRPRPHKKPATSAGRSGGW